MTVQEYRDQYGEIETFIDADGYKNVLVEKSVGLDAALKLANSIFKENSNNLALCFCHDDGENVSYRRKDCNKICVWRLKTEKL